MRSLFILYDAQPCCVLMVCFFNKVVASVTKCAMVTVSGGVFVAQCGALVA